MSTASLVLQTTRWTEWSHWSWRHRIPFEVCHAFPCDWKSLSASAAFSRYPLRFAAHSSSAQVWSQASRAAPSWFRLESWKFRSVLRKLLGRRAVDQLRLQSSILRNGYEIHVVTYWDPPRFASSLRRTSRATTKQSPGNVLQFHVSCKSNLPCVSSSILAMR